MKVTKICSIFLSSQNRLYNNSAFIESSDGVNKMIFLSLADFAQSSKANFMRPKKFRNSFCEVFELFLSS
jgi:hypothetical protein